MSAPAALPRLIREIADLAFASVCAGCGVPGAALCPHCERRLASQVQRLSLAGLRLRAGIGFDGVAAAVLRAVKQDGQTSLLRPLRPALATAIGDLCGDAARDAVPDAVLVPVPTSFAAFRRRGYRVPELLARGWDLPARRVLRYARRVEDQRGLSVEDRRRNVDGALLAARAGRARTAIIVDDVITTGATCAEAARALRTAGFTVLGAVAVAATPRERDRAA